MMCCNQVAHDTVNVVHMVLLKNPGAKAWPHVSLRLTFHPYHQVPIPTAPPTLRALKNGSEGMP